MSRRERVLQSAISLFASQGYDATTTYEIATAANVTEPVIYYYFKNKDGLFTHILAETFIEYFSRLAALEPDPPEQFTKIENLIDLHFAFVEDYPEQVYIVQHR